MIIWCLKENEPAKKFYKKMGGNAVAQRLISIGSKEYKEVGFVFEI